MSNFNTITIVIVAYLGDVDLLKRLLNSIKTFCPIEQIVNIIIIINDHPNTYKTFYLIEDEFNSLPIKIIPGIDLEPNIDHYNWNTQQFFKCVVSKNIETDWYIIHDCKDYYIDYVNFIDECFNTQNQAIMPLDQTNYNSNNKDGRGGRVFNLALNMSYKLYNPNNGTENNWHLPTITPFIVKTSNMKELTSDLENKLEGFFPLLFSLAINEDKIFTEFLLYSSFCINKNKLNDYVDISYGTKYFSKVKQDKSLRVNFPQEFNIGQKFHVNNEVWILTNTGWEKASS